MPRHFTAADLLAIANGEHSLRREPRVETAPLERPVCKPAVLIEGTGLPRPRSRTLTAADILAISRHDQPWRALETCGTRLHAAG